MTERLTALRQGEAALREAEEAFEAAEDQVGEMVAFYQGCIRAALEARANGTPVGPADPAIETQGNGALGVVAAARDAVIAARRHLGDEIAQLVRTEGLVVGDRFVTPSSREPLTVATISRTPVDPALGEVTLTADGGLVLKAEHSWPLDETGRAVFDDRPRVRYERWCAMGLRNAGFVHAGTRQLLFGERQERVG